MSITQANFRINHVTIGFDEIPEFDKRVLSNILITDFRLINYDNNKQITSDNIIDMFKNSNYFQQAFDKCKDENNNVDLNVYSIKDITGDTAYNYITFTAYPSLAFVLISISNVNYETFKVNYDDTLFKAFIENKDIKTNLITNMLDVLLDVNSPVNYGSIVIHANHHHDKKAKQINGIHIKSITTDKPKLKSIHFTSSDKQLIYNSCNHIDDRRKYKMFLLNKILNLLHNEARNNKHVHDFIIEILAPNKEVMYSVYSSTKHEAMLKDRNKHLNDKIIEFNTKLIEAIEQRDEVTKQRDEQSIKLTEITKQRDEQSIKLTEVTKQRDEAIKIIEELKAKLALYENS